MKNFTKLTKLKFIATIIYDKEEELYTITMLDKRGGPIVSDVNLDEAKAKFKNGLMLSLAVSNLISFKNGGEWIGIDEIDEIEFIDRTEEFYENYDKVI